MEQGLKERLVGAAVLVILAVIFIPMLLDNRTNEDIVISATNIPPKPDNLPEPPRDTDFSSRIIPLKEPAHPADVVESPGKQEQQVKPEQPGKPGTNESNAMDETIHAEISSLPGDESGKAEGEPVTNVGLTAWVVQLGSFSNKENAESLNQKLRKAGYRSFVEPLKQGETLVFRVRVGPELEKSQAEAINKKLKETMKIEGIVVNYP